MKILLIKPYNLSDHIQPALGLGYLASSLRKDHDVTILDCIKTRIKPEKFRAVIEKNKPDVAGIQCYTYDLYKIKEMLKEISGLRITTVLGGPHPSAAPLETFEFFGGRLDYIFRGEAEVGFKMLIDKLAGKTDVPLEEIPGLGWRKDGKIELNDVRFVEDLDDLEMPAWDLIRPKTYPEAQHGAFFKKFPIAPIITTRGCPYFCTFCAGSLISGRRLRTRTPDNVLDEIKMLYRTRGIREFHVIDDNFTLNKNFAKTLLKKLKAENLDISWSVPNGVRMDTLDDELLELMKDTGLYLISLGIESGSDRILRLMRKNITTDEIRQSVARIRKHGIDIAGFFILGFPGETVEDIEKTIEFSLELDLIRANFFTYLPLPGTESYNGLKAAGLLKGIDLKKFYFMNATFTPEGIGRGTLKALQRKAFMKFFLRPRVMLRNFNEIKSSGHLKFLSGRFARWMILK